VNTNSNEGSRSIRDCFAITIQVPPVAQKLRFETIIEFQANLAENLITVEIKQNIRVETSKILQIDLLRISEVNMGNRGPARRLLATRMSYTIRAET